ncbi:hypothetical protein HWD94_08095 [Pseudarthrobacter equi]|nr:hypothetical protein [Pseudarthrobacter equi]
MAAGTGRLAAAAGQLDTGAGTLNKLAEGGLRPCSGAAIGKLAEGGLRPCSGAAQLNAVAAGSTRGSCAQRQRRRGPAALTRQYS